MIATVSVFAPEDASIEVLERALASWFVLGDPTDEPCGVIGIGAASQEALALASRGGAAALVLLHPLAAPVTGIDVPTLILWGEDDAENGIGQVEAIHDGIDSSSLGLLPGCGADLLKEAPQTVVPLAVEFLRSRYLGASHGHGGPVPLQIGRVGEGP